MKVEVTFTIKSPEDYEEMVNRKIIKGGPLEQLFELVKKSKEEDK